MGPPEACGQSAAGSRELPLEFRAASAASTLNGVAQPGTGTVLGLGLGQDLGLGGSLSWRCSVCYSVFGSFLGRPDASSSRQQSSLFATIKTVFWG